jgi:hypothetical protein
MLLDFSSVLKYDMPTKQTGVGLPNHSCPNQLDTTAAVDAEMTKDSPTSFGMASIQGVKKNGKHAYLVNTSLDLGHLWLACAISCGTSSSRSPASSS